MGNKDTKRLPLPRTLVLHFATASEHHDFLASTGGKISLKRHKIVQKVMSGSCANVSRR